MKNKLSYQTKSAQRYICSLKNTLSILLQDAQIGLNGKRNTYYYCVSLNVVIRIVVKIEDIKLKFEKVPDPHSITTIIGDTRVFG